MSCCCRFHCVVTKVIHYVVTGVCCVIGVHHISSVPHDHGAHCVFNMFVNRVFGVPHILDVCLF